MSTGEPGPRAAVDIGGTFTDLVAVGSGGELVFGKAPTTPAALEEGVMRTLAHAGVGTESLSLFVHGTTVVVNSITERRGARTALITTRGFRDVLEIGRANRRDLYNLSYRKPVPLVPRRLRFEVTERMSYRGEVLEPLAEEEIEGLVGRLRDDGAEAVAVCFLHSWANPEHERRARDILVKLPQGGGRRVPRREQAVARVRAFQHRGPLRVREVLAAEPDWDVPLVQRYSVG